MTSCELVNLLFFTPCLLKAPWDTCPIKYHYVNQKKSWTEAQQYCREHFTDLATIINDDTMAEVISITANTPNFWIGLYGSWEWCLDDKDFYGHGEADFRFWKDGDPDVTSEQSCALIHESKEWKDTSCGSPHVVICYNSGETQPFTIELKHALELYVKHVFRSVLITNSHNFIIYFTCIAP